MGKKMIVALLALLCFGHSQADLSNASKLVPLNPNDYPMKVDAQEALYKTYDYSWAYVSIISVCKEVPDEFVDQYFDPFDLFCLTLYGCLSYMVIYGVYWLLQIIAVEKHRDGKCGCCIEYVFAEACASAQEKADETKEKTTSATIDETEARSEVGKLAVELKTHAEAIKETLAISDEAQLVLFWSMQLIIGLAFWVEYWKSGPSGNKIGYEVCALVHIGVSPFYKPCCAPFLACVLNIFEAQILRATRGEFERPRCVYFLSGTSGALLFIYYVSGAHSGITASYSVLGVLVGFSCLLCCCGCCFAVCATAVDEKIFGGAIEAELRRREEDAEARGKADDAGGPLGQLSAPLKSLLMRCMLLCILMFLQCNNAALVLHRDPDWSRIQSYTAEVFFGRLGRGFGIPSITWPNFNLSFDIKWTIPVALLATQKFLGLWTHWYQWPSQKKAHDEQKKAKRAEREEAKKTEGRNANNDHEEKRDPEAGA